MIHSLVQLLLDFTAGSGYWGVFFLMTVESSFIPFPSELVIPPAAYLASQGQMDLGLIVFFGTLGSLAGALVNYYLAMWLGRPLVFAIAQHRWFVFLTVKQIERAEAYFLKFGNASTFFGRLVPVVRQLISLPAGFSEMKLRPFVLFTSLGASIYVLLLALLGYFFGSQKDVLITYVREFGLFFLVLFVLILGALYFKLRKR